VDLSDVFWICGGPGSGKTSVSRALAYRHDLQLYNLDHRTYVHHGKLGDPEIRWDLPPQELADRFCAYACRRFPLVLEDLAGLPPSPGAIAEGPHLLPELVPDGAAAVFLVPTEERIRATRTERGSKPVVADRDVLLAARIREQAELRGLTVLAVDRPLAAMIDAVEELLPLAALPRDGDRSAIRQCENDVLARQVRLYRASGAAGEGDWPLPFACECGERGCGETVELTLAAYDALSAAGDRSPLRRPRS
jgi:hypothetical protein